MTDYNDLYKEARRILDELFDENTAALYLAWTGWERAVELEQERDALREAGQQLLNAANDLTVSEPCGGISCPGCALLKAKAAWEKVASDD